MNEQEKYNWKVCVRCFTFNQAPYIEDAFNGFTIQETSFPYICCIVDDASTDGEQEIIAKYLKVNFDLDNKAVLRNEETDYYRLTFAQHKSNKNCYFAVLWLKYNHFGTKQLKARKFEYISEWLNNSKYHALCEGDDYWTDPLKLQKQYDFLESHPDYSCCHTGFACVDKQSKPIVRRDYERKSSLGANGERFWYTMLVENYILYCTFMVRSEIMLTCPTWYHDYGQFLHAARHGYVGFIPDKTSCYRQTPGSIMNEPNKLANLRIAHKRVTVNEIEKIIKKEKGTIEKVSNFPNKNKAIARMLIFCFQKEDKKLRNKVLRLFFHHPFLFIYGFIQKIRGKAPKDFYLPSETIL